MNLRIVVFCVSVAAFSEAIANDKVAEQTESSSLEVAATLEPLGATTLLNQLEGRSVIQSIVPEGTTVKAGDVVCTMDVARHRDRVAALRLEIERTRAEIATSKAVLAATERKAAALQSSASRRLKIAQMALKSWTLGESKVQQLELEGAILICITELEYAKGVAEAADKVDSPIEKLRGRVEVTKAEVKLQSAERRLAHHREFVHPQRVAKLELEMEQAAAEVEQACADRGEASRTADLAAKTQQLAMQEQQLKKAMEQQQLGQIIAPHDGVVVYANQNSRRPNSIALQAGQEIRERQALAHLHDRSRMRALIELNADHAKQLEPGQRVDVQVDALPNHSFDGTLTAFLNEKDSAEGLSKAWILIDPAKGVPLLDGMTAVVTIELDR